MRLNKFLLASCLSLSVLAGCSSTASTDTSTNAETSTQTTETKTAAKTKAATKTKTKSTASSKEDSTSSATEDTSSSKTSSSKKTSTVDTASNSTLDTITSDLKSKGYSVRNDTVDWDNGIIASTVKQEIECDGVQDYTIWEFNSDADAAASFDSVEKTEKADLENSVSRNGNLITITDREDGDQEYYVLSGSLIVESDAYDALTNFQTWNLL